MKKNKGKKISKASRNYYMNLLTILPFLLLVLSGLTVLRYHGGEARQKPLDLTEIHGLQHTGFWPLL